MELYNKYRPESFDKILGNDLAVKSLKSELEANHHVFLVTGPSGTGKTTLARACAKEMGCDDLSIREINASDDRGIDAMRGIKEEMRYAPPNVNGKLVFIFDECHSITPPAQECILKMLEDCPEWVYIFLCTTNPEKLLETIKTRCSKITMKPLDLQTMTGLLRRVIHYEEKSINVDIVNEIAALAKGSSRMALKILGSVLYLESDEERLAYIRENNFSDENEDAIELCRALIKQEGWNKYAECLEKLKDELETSSEGVRHLVMSYAISVLKKGMNPVAVAMLQAFSNADTYKNKGKAIWVAVLDYMSMLAG